MPLDTALIDDIERWLAEPRAAQSAACRDFAHALRNLLDRLREGAVEVDGAAARLVRDACAAAVDADAARLADLAERIDALASGLADVEFGARPQRSGVEPPVLTEREDGKRVLPGMFADDPAQDVADLADIARALAGVAGRLRHCATELRLFANGRVPMHCTDGIDADAGEIERLGRALAAHSAPAAQR